MSQQDDEAWSVHYYWALLSCINVCTYSTFIQTCILELENRCSAIIYMKNTGVAEEFGALFVLAIQGVLSLRLWRSHHP